MSGHNSVADRFAATSESDLQRQALEVKSLTPVAREALRLEMERRHLSAKSINWKAHPCRSCA